MKSLFRDAFYRKLFFSLLALALIPIMAAGFYYSFLASKNNRESVLDASDIYLRQGSANIAEMVDQIDCVTQLAFSDKSLQNVMRDSLYFTATERMAVIDQFLLNLNTVTPAASDMMILSGDDVYSRYRSATKMNKHFRAFGQPWYYDTILANGGLVVTGSRDSFFGVSSKRVITLSRAILDLSSVSRDQLGFLLVELDSSYLGELFGKARDLGNGTLIITDERGNILYHSGNELPDAAIALDSSFWQNESGKKNQVEFEGRRQMINFTTEKTTGWKIFHLIPESYIQKLSDEIFRTNVTLMVIAALLATVLAAMLARALANPIRRLQTLVFRIGEGELGAKEETDKMGALKELGEGINIMSTGLSELLETNYEMRIESKEAELRALQSQINPHFLYNTLNSIQLLAVYKNEREIAQMIADLGTFFHLSLSSTTDVVPLSKEVKLAETYVSLQQVRFGERIKLREEIDESLLDIPVPKLILQPIVENAIIHGLESKIEGGEILIRIEKSDHGVHIEVRDNGVGMEEEELNACLNNLRKKGNDEKGRVSIGMRNVERRLRLYSGHLLGLSIESKKGEGTYVSLDLPKEGVQLKKGKKETLDSSDNN